MAEFRDADLSGSVYDNVNLSGSTIRNADLSRLDVRGASLEGARLRGVEMLDVDISGELQNVRINGVDVTGYVESELGKRHPELTKMRPDDPEGYREAWTILEKRWDETIARAGLLDPALLHASVDGEWSFVETLLHLAFATDAWLRRCIQGDPAPWHPLDLPWDEAPDVEGLTPDRSVQADLDEVLELRRDRQAGVRHFLDGLTAEQLAAHTTPVDAPGWPPPESFPVADCLRTILNEEWWHRQFAERDLASLAD